MGRSVLGVSNSPPNQYLYEACDAFLRLDDAVTRSRRDRTKPPASQAPSRPTRPTSVPALLEAIRACVDGLVDELPEVSGPASVKLQAISARLSERCGVSTSELARRAGLVGHGDATVRLGTLLRWAAPGADINQQEIVVPAGAEPSRWRPAAASSNPTVGLARRTLVDLAGASLGLPGFADRLDVLAGGDASVPVVDRLSARLASMGLSIPPATIAEVLGTP
jgi:hypothetical protein